MTLVTTDFSSNASGGLDFSPLLPQPGSRLCSLLVCMSASGVPALVSVRLARWSVFVDSIFRSDPLFRSNAGSLSIDFSHSVLLRLSSWKLGPISFVVGLVTGLTYPSGLSSLYEFSKCGSWFSLPSLLTSSISGSESLPDWLSITGTKCAE